MPWFSYIFVGSELHWYSIVLYMFKNFLYILYLNTSNAINIKARKKLDLTLQTDQFVTFLKHFLMVDLKSLS